MNEKGKSNVRSYIAVIVILVCALIFIFYLLETEKSRLKAKPMVEEKTTSTSSTTEILLPEGETTTTTIAIDNNVGASTPVNVEPVTNFNSSLFEIINGLYFYEDYNVTTYFHGVEFTFKCNNYNEETSICSGGSALMKVNDALFPLYTYAEESGNFLLRPNDYYIYLDNNMVMLYTSNTNSVGEMRVFDLRGSQVGTVKNTLTGYKFKDNFFNRLYPSVSIEDNRIYYYSCVNDQVVISSTEIGNYDNVEVLENVEGSCY